MHHSFVLITFLLLQGFQSWGQGPSHFVGAYHLEKSMDTFCYEDIEIVLKEKNESIGCQDEAMKVVGLPRGSGLWIEQVCNFNAGQQQTYEKDYFLGSPIAKTISIARESSEQIVYESKTTSLRWGFWGYFIRGSEMILEKKPQGLQLQHKEWAQGQSLQRQMNCLYSKK